MRRLALRFASLTASAIVCTPLACSTRASRLPAPGPEPGRVDAGRTIRVALIVPQPRISGTREFSWFQPDGRSLIARARRGEEWRVEAGGLGGRQVRALRPDGVPTAWNNLLIARPQESTGFVAVNGKRYRGQLVVSAPDGGLNVVNHVGIEDYLRGVVATEMGKRPRGDSAALMAQAVASRSFAYLRLASRGEFDVRSSVLDQVYGGVDVENAEASAAVDATRGLMLRHQGRVADALYHSTCGGSTAESPEVWRTAGMAYLQRVSDRIGETNRYYCDAAPRFRWTRTLSATQLTDGVAQYLKAYAAVPSGGPGTVRHVAIQGKTKSGRVAELEIETERGAYAVRGDDIRYVMRAPGGEMLSSTYFSVEPEYSSGGVLEKVTFRGQGYGHGVGMCQWGAIGRARAGQSFRQILATYYPGTSVGPIQ